MEIVTTKRKKRKVTKRKRQRTQQSKPRLTMAEAQRLGVENADLLEADLDCPGKTNLAKALAGHPRLKQAFRRGQLLQQLKRLAPVTDSITHAAIRLKKLGFEFETGRELRDYLDSDAEALEIWNEADANAWIENRELLRAAAKDGNVKAIQLIDAWFTGRER